MEQLSVGLQMTPEYLGTSEGSSQLTAGRMPLIIRDDVVYVQGDANGKGNH